MVMKTKDPTNKDILDAVTQLSGVVSQIAVDVSTLKSDVSTLKSDVSTLKAEMNEVKDEQERQGKKLDQIASFTHFTSGAFVA
jgi:outer membrane murein-binding lipoprotein Lpp